MATDSTTWSKAGVVSLALVLVWWTWPSSATAGEAGSRSYQGKRCPFDPREMTSAALEEQLKSQPERFPRLLCAAEALRQDDAEVRVVALRALADAYPCLSSEIGAIADEASNGNPRGGAKKATRGSVGMLVSRLEGLLLSGDSDDKRRCAANLLGVVGDPNAIEALAESLNDRDINVRHDVVTALRAIRDPHSLDPLIRAARDPYVGFAAVPGVAAIGGPRARDALIEIMDDRKLAATVRLSAARELRVTGDPKAVAAAERHLASLRPQWHRAFYWAGLLYVLAFMASRTSARGWWAIAYYASVVASVMILINPVWLITGQEKAAFWGLAIWYPAGLGLGALPILGILRLLHHEEIARAIGKRILRAILVMWGTLMLWVVVVFIMMIIGLGLAWR